uniref:WKF domain-containing protein n=1 Tax=Anopheles christyi TaxID=43041 RepID=A0A182K162_9DIPT
MQSNNNSQNKSRSGNRPAAKQKGDKQKKKQKSSVKKAKSPKGSKTDKVKPLEKNDKVKHEAIAKKLQVKTKGKEQEEIQKYLECWTNNREQWKFNKMIQVFIQHHVLDEAVINAEMWPMALSYLSGTKGSGKDILVANAKSIIKEVDSAVEGNGDETLQASSKYERARELLQSLG